MKDDTREEHEIVSAWREAVAHEAPPPALDAKIRAAAHAASPVSRRRPRYFVPLALAASVVVAVGLGLRQQHGEAPLPASPSVTPPPPVTRPAARASAEQAAPLSRPPPANEEARAEAHPAPAAAPEVEAQAPGVVAPQAAAKTEAPASPVYARAGRGGFHRDSDTAAVTGGAASAPDADVVATIRALLARGERDAAVALAREYSARRPVPPALPDDLRVLLGVGVR